MASANSAALRKWWKNDPVVTPARSATAAVVAPASTFGSGSSSITSSPARTRRARGSSVPVPSVPEVVSVVDTHRA